MSIGDRIFLHRQGAAPRGIVGYGHAVTRPYLDESWKGTGSTENYVDVEWLFLSETPVLSSSDLERPPLDAVLCPTQVSGIQISPDASMAIEAALPTTIGIKSDHALADDLVGLEGEPLARMLVHRKRESALREAKVKDAIRRGDGRLTCEGPLRIRTSRWPVQFLRDGGRGPQNRS